MGKNISRFIGIIENWVSRQRIFYFVVDGQIRRCRELSVIELPRIFPISEHDVIVRVFYWRGLFMDERKYIGVYIDYLALNQ
ncbi:MAG: hypothetical protein MJZ20_09535 [Bacteroidaceae bacterium]|nr:hypothetical protein [Bacteroidaceae bacterium]